MPPFFFLRSESAKKSQIIFFTNEHQHFRVQATAFRIINGCRRARIFLYGAKPLRRRRFFVQNTFLQPDAANTVNVAAARNLPIFFILPFFVLTVYMKGRLKTKIRFSDDLFLRTDFIRLVLSIRLQSIPVRRRPPAFWRPRVRARRRRRRGLVRLPARLPNRRGVRPARAG